MGNTYTEDRDYVAVAASTTKGSLGTGSKVIDGDILMNVLIIPATTSPGAVTVFDGAGGSGMIIFPGGATSVADLKPIYVQLNIRAKNAAANASGPRWLMSTGANVSVIATGDFN